MVLLGNQSQYKEIIENSLTNLEASIMGRDISIIEKALKSFNHSGSICIGGISISDYVKRANGLLKPYNLSVEIDKMLL